MKSFGNGRDGFVQGDKSGEKEGWLPSNALKILHKKLDTSH